MVRVRAAGLNAADLQRARREHPAPPGWPADVPGPEIAGEVEHVGSTRGSLIGTTVRGRAPAEKALLAGLVRTSVVPLLARRLRVPVDAAFPLDRHADGCARLAGPGKFGEVVPTRG